MALMRDSEEPTKEFDVVKEQLSDQAVREFMLLYERIYGIKLERYEAEFRARNLVTLYAAVLGKL